MASINSSEHAVNLQLMGRLMLVLLVAGCVVADTAPFTSYVLQYNPGALQQASSTSSRLRSLAFAMHSTCSALLRE